MSFFNSIELLQEDPILSLPLHFAADPRTFKVDLGIGVYRDKDGVQSVLNCVRQAEARLLERKLDKKYLPIEGYKPYIDATINNIFGNSHSKNILGIQTLGGTGALFLGSKFLCKHVGKTIFVSDPCWPNHPLIFSRAGLTIRNYPYYCPEKVIDFEGICAAIAVMEPASIILLQVSCHNPTGTDPSIEQWKYLSELIRKRNIFPFFDFAYQGLGDDLARDAAAIRLFYEQGHEMLVAYSYSKNMGLYGERVGALALVSRSPGSLSRIASQLKQLARSIYSMPPLNGARIAAEVLDSPELQQAWRDELTEMQQRITTMRTRLQEGLRDVQNRDFSYIKKQRGLFSYIGLTELQVKQLQKKYAIYMPASGRINVAGFTEANVDYALKSLQAVLRNET